MFTGHYAPALAIKSRFPQVPLWQLFLAAQAIDILFFVYAPCELEHLTLDHTRPSLLALRIDQMHWSHSLAATAAYASLFIIWGVWAKKRAAGTALGLTTLSHWFLDALVHTPDVPVAPGLDWKVGLRLWEYGWIAWVVEITFLGLCGGLLWRQWSQDPRGRKLLIFLAILVMIQTLNVFVVPLPKTVLELAFISELSFFGFAFGAYTVEFSFSGSKAAKQQAKS